MIYSFLRRHFLFHLPPETAHALALRTLAAAAFCGFRQTVPDAPLSVMGLHFRNPFGLAAGFDKNAAYLDALSALGFGFIEVGTVTPRPQSGNPKPRLFRLVPEEALINRMGFNNDGMDVVAKNLERRRYRGILGVNIGKNRDTPLDNATADYLLCFNKLAPLADYITVNISSPNTPGLRTLQSGDNLTGLLSALKDAQQTLEKNSGRYVPLVIKIAPDMDSSQLTVLGESLITYRVDGVIAGNTTTSREGVERNPLCAESGGLSGRPLTEKATAAVRTLNNVLKNRIPIIGCGGVFTQQHALEKFSAGASLIQVYTGLIFQGPDILKIKLSEPLQ